jgi:GNAT superfamily N-acetyltransferase
MPAPGSAACHTIEIRPALDNEARACRILLPEMFTAEQSPDALIAVDAAGSDGMPCLAGAVASGTVHAPRAPGFPFWLHVVPEHRRQGIGRALLGALVQRCRGRTTILRAAQPVPAASQAAQFLAACGFGDFDEIHHFEADTKSFHAQMLAVREKLARRGAIPPSARVVALRDAPPGDVATLMTAHFPTPRAHVLARLTPGAPDGFDLDNSVAILLGDTLAGVLVYVWKGRIPVIELRAVAPGFRGGWVNAWLLEAATRRGMQAGSTHFHFFADTGIADTMRLAARARATLIKVERRFWRRLD